MPTPEQLALVAVIIMAAFSVQISIGFGAGLVAAPLLAFIVGAKDAVTILLIFQFLGGIVLLYEWRNVSLREIKALAPAIILGLAIGMLLNGYLNERWVTFALGFYILGFVALDIIGTIWKYTPKPNVVVSGTAGGVIQALFGTGGPPLIAYLHAQQLTKTQFRATALAVFFFSNLLRLIVAVPAQLIQKPVLIFSIAAVPGFLFALWLGNRLHGMIPAAGFRRIILAVLVGSGGALVYRASVMA